MKKTERYSLAISSLEKSIEQNPEFWEEFRKSLEVTGKLLKTNRKVFDHMSPLIEDIFKIKPDKDFFLEFIDIHYGNETVYEIFSRPPEELIKEYAEYYNKKYTTVLKKPKKSAPPDTFSLKDILKDPGSVETVKGYYFSMQKQGKIRLTMFIKHLKDKGYYVGEVTTKMVELIAKNDFNTELSENRYGPPRPESREYLNHPWSTIPTYITPK